jgi:hypothetical protein
MARLETYRSAARLRLIPYRAPGKVNAYAGDLPSTSLIPACVRGMLSRDISRGGDAMQVSTDKRRAITTVSGL